MKQKFPFPPAQYVLVGTVTRAHGIGGELKIKPLADRRETLMNHGRVALIATDGRMTELLDVLRTRIQEKQVIAKLDTIDTRNEADLTVGMGVLLARDDLAEETVADSGGSAYIGMQVHTRDTQLIGTVSDVLQTGAHDVLVIHAGEREYLVPVVPEFICGTRDNTLTIDPPPGLLELGSEDSGR